MKSFHVLGWDFVQQPEWLVHLLPLAVRGSNTLFHQPGDCYTTSVLFSLPGLVCVNRQRVSPHSAPGKARMQLVILAS